MATDHLRETLHLRIEQADEQLLRTLAEIAESLFRSYQPQVIEQEELLAYQAGETISTAELQTKINIAEDQIDRGEFLTPQELEKEAEGWLSESIG